MPGKTEVFRFQTFGGLPCRSCQTLKSLLTVVTSNRHKQSGQAIVTLSGRDILLGKHGTKESRDAYNRITAEWLAGERIWA